MPGKKQSGSEKKARAATRHKLPCGGSGASKGGQTTARGRDPVDPAEEEQKTWAEFGKNQHR